jgi:urease accessory protein
MIDSQTIKHNRSHSETSATFSGQTGRTLPEDLYQSGALRMFFPNTSGSATQAIIANSSGGVVGGDELKVSVEAGDCARILVTTQSAEKVYRSPAHETLVNVTLRACSNASLEWLPQETILFDGVRLRRQLLLETDNTSSLLAGEILVFGRTARGESLTHGLVHDEWRVRRDGRLVWADSLHLTGDIGKRLADPAGFNNSKGMATLVYVSGDAAHWLDAAKELIRNDVCQSGVTCINSVLIARWLARDTAELRIEYRRFVDNFRRMTSCKTSALPSIWSF